MMGKELWSEVLSILRRACVRLLVVARVCFGIVQLGAMSLVGYLCLHSGLRS